MNKIIILIVMLCMLSILTFAQNIFYFGKTTNPFKQFGTANGKIYNQNSVTIKTKDIQLQDLNNFS